MSKEGASESDFRQILRDLVNDLCSTFPDLSSGWPADVLAMRSDGEESEAAGRLKTHCSKVLPLHFFHIVYENDELFDSDTPLCILPEVDFVKIWKAEGLSDSIRATIWKYLQLMVLAVVADMEDGKSFGDAAPLFEAIDVEEFKTKLEEMVAGMADMGVNGDEALPSPEGLKDHIDKILGGKLGMLAKEIAEETADELGITDAADKPPMDTFKRLFKDPAKLLQLVKSIGGKLDAKIKSGEIKEAELLGEATELLKNMGSMPGMSHLKDLFAKQAGVDLSKVDPKVMESRMKTSMRGAAQRDRLRAKLAKRKQAAEVPAPPAAKTAAESQAAVLESLKEVKKKRGKKKRRPK